MWKGSFISYFAGSIAEITLISELYTLTACGKNRIIDIDNVQWASACQGVFYIFENFFKKLESFRRFTYSRLGYGVKGRIISLCSIWIRKEVNSYGAIFFRKEADDQASV